MQGCTEPAEPESEGLCKRHVAVLAASDRTLPIKYVQDPEGATFTICGLCGKWVWFLERIDSPRHELWPIDSTSSPFGKCEIVNGGFRVVSGSLFESAVALGIPLYRAHTTTCMRRLALVARALGNS